MKQASIDNVPDARVDEVMQEFRDEGAVDVQKVKNPNGTWKVTATFA